MELKDLLLLLGTGAAGFMAGLFLAPDALRPGRAPRKGHEDASGDEEDDEELADDEEYASSSDDEGYLHVSGREAIKLVLVVRTDLKMGKGKTCSQCAHAAVGACTRLAKKDRATMRRYTMEGQKKIVVKAPNEETLLRLEDEAKKLGLMSYLVCDAGRTQIAPNTLTVLAVGPGPVSVVDRVTGSLKLMS